MTWKIYIVEDHDVVRESYVMFINMEGRLEVCGQAATAAAALKDLEKVDPDLILVDISLPDMSGIELVQRLRAKHPVLPALVVTGHDNALYRDGAMQAGARGFVMKHQGPDALIRAIYGVLESVN